MNAPGGPGSIPRWTSSAKSGVGTSLTPESCVWFTISHGIVNEIYYPRLDEACTRDLGLLVADGKDFFSEEKRQTRSEVQAASDGVPAFRLTNTERDGRYRIDKEIVTDPRRDVLLQRIRFVPLKGKDYRLYVLLAPHLKNRGAGNTGWIGDYKGVPMLFAERDGSALALACSAPWLKRSAGFVGSSDGWQDLSQHKHMAWTYERAENGNVALIGEIDLAACNGEFELALGFGRSAAEAGHQARFSLVSGFDAAWNDYVQGWQAWQKTLAPLDRKLFRTSAAVLRTHEAKDLSCGLIASLSIPWGMSKGDDDLGGYHLVWPRDMVETAGGLLAAGAHKEAKRLVQYLQATQEADGHWPQNMWLDGTPYWGGLQMDETSFPILLVDLARRERALDAEDLKRLQPMVRKAAEFIVRNGPVTQQDRWEEDAGYSPFTLAAEVAALLAAADMADKPAADYLRETADAWNASIERWTYVAGTELARRVGVEGYYVRIGTDEGDVPVKNRPPDRSRLPASELVSPDALALVRFGLRAPDDPRIVNTVKVIDALLKAETPRGPSWYRYNEDGYGEHEDGSPFDGTGIGRPWPLLTGERAHYELAAGRVDAARKLLQAMEAFAGDGGMLPEQIWDAADLPDRELFHGAPSGSAMPLVWAHAEYIKLCRSLRDGRVFDMPPQTAKRYGGRKPDSPYVPWRFNHKCREIPAGKILRFELLAPASVHWSPDDWKTVTDVPTRDTGLGLYVVDLKIDRPIEFTFYWPDTDRWEGTDFSVIPESKIV